MPWNIAIMHRFQVNSRVQLPFNRINHAPARFKIITEIPLSTGRFGHSQPEVSLSLPSASGLSA